MTKRKHFSNEEDSDEEDIRDDDDLADNTMHHTRRVLRQQTRKFEADRVGKYTKKFR
jgi:hypothetical protein